MSTSESPKQISEEVRNKAFAKRAEVQIAQLYQLAEIIDLASKRGAFRGPELTHVGTLFDKLSVAVDSAFNISKREIAAEAAEAASAVEETKLEAIPESPSDEVAEATGNVAASVAAIESKVNETE